MLWSEVLQFLFTFSRYMFTYFVIVESSVVRHTEFIVNSLFHTTSLYSPIKYNNVNNNKITGRFLEWRSTEYMEIILICKQQKGKQKYGPKVNEPAVLYLVDFVVVVLCCCYLWVCVCFLLLLLNTLLWKLWTDFGSVSWATLYRLNVHVYDYNNHSGNIKYLFSA